MDNQQKEDWNPESKNDFENDLSQNHSEIFVNHLPRANYCFRHLARSVNESKDPYPCWAYCPERWQQVTDSLQWVRKLSAPLSLLHQYPQFPKCGNNFSVLGQMNEQRRWDICTMKHRLALTKEEILPPETAHMDLEDILLGKLRKTQKEKCCMISL